MTTAPVHSIFGTPFGGTALANAAGSTVTRAMHDGVRYEGHRSCMANNASCRGPRAKGTDFCIGHLRAMEKETAKDE